MSLATGYADVLVLQNRNGVCIVEGLSPAGYEFINNKISYAATFSSTSVHVVIRAMNAAHLTVEVRANEQAEILRELNTAHRAQDQRRVDAGHGRTE